MPSRLRVFFSVWLFAVLFSMQLLAQSSSTSLAQHRARALKRSAEFSGSLQTPALSFASAVPYLSGGNGPNAVAVADVNRDGIPDLVVANWCTDSTCVASSVGVMLGNGGGTFKPAVAYGSGGHYADSVAVADVNGDGKADIVVGTCGFPQVLNCVASGGKAGVLLGNGDGTFQPAVSYTLGGFGATSVAIADVNGDGKPDLLVATGSAVGVLLGNGDGTFQTVTKYSSGGFKALSVAVEDVNGDAKPDLVVANWCTDSACTASSVGVLLGNGDGTFQTAVAYGSGGLFANSVVIGDVNGDGKLDLVVVNGSTTGTDAGNVGVLLGNGDGTFQPVALYPRDPRGGYGAGSVALSDVNGDGKPDVVVSNCSTSSIACAHSDGDVAVLLGKGDGTFTTAVSFGSGGTAPFGMAVGDVNADGRPDIVAANCVGSQCGLGAGELGVLINQSGPWLVYASLAQQVDYFGQGKADFTVWRPSTATWYVAGSGQQLITPWGSSTDVPVIGDYDGDGKTDIAVWRPSTGIWYVIEPGANKVVTQQWGQQGDVPVPGDYDGDGKTDFAVWRPSTGVWYIIQSSNGQVVEVKWGQQGDVPVPGDYDGDGKTDIAVWRPSTGTWYVIEKGANKIVVLQWGQQGDVPVPGDYDGDGKTDIAVWRPSTGTWYVIEPGANKIVTLQWGSAGDVPVARDYDGDLKADFAVWRPSTGVWYVVQSSNNQVVQVQWGKSGDIPVNKPVGQ